MSKNICIISTKKLLSNQRQFLLNADFSVVEANFIETSFLPIEINEIFDFLIFTSQNAVQAILNLKDLEYLKKISVLCVGKKTEALLKKNGFQVRVATNSANELTQIIAKDFNKNSFTFFCGESRLETLPHFFEENQYKWNSFEVYTTELVPVKIKSKANGILFFSPSGVKSYLIENNITNETCFCIGTTTAKALENVTKNIIIANQPSVENVIIQCINYYKN